MGVNRTRGDVGLNPPHVVEQSAARLNTILSIVKRHEQLELERRQLDLQALYPHAVSLAVDLELAELDRGFQIFHFVLATTHDGLNAKQELPDAERFGHVVIGTQLEANHAVDLFTPGGEHDHVDALGGLTFLELLTDLGSRDIGEHQVQKHHVRLLLARDAQAFAPQLGHENLVASLPEVVLQHLLEIGFVFDDQNASHPRNRVPGNCDDCVAAG